MVTPKGADPVFHAPVVEAARLKARKHHQLNNPYFFYVGGWEERKNIPFLIHAFARTNLEGVELVLAGGRDEQRQALLALAKDLGVAERLRLLGWVDDEALPGLYAEAIAFIYPSRYEGFGLQLCEAMAVGCPTLAADATCLPEVLGDGGALFSLESTDELAQLMRKTALEPAYREALRVRGTSRSKDFSWRITAQKTIDVYESLLAKRGP